MENIQEFLKTKIKKDTYLSDFCKELQAFESAKNYTILSEKSVMFGLLLLNGIPELFEYAHQKNANVQIQKDTKRYKKLLELLEIKVESEGKSEVISGQVPPKKWGEFNDFWIYFFGKEITKYIVGACELVEKAPYQTGYYRRSFTAPNMSELCFLRQLYFLNSLMHDLRYNFTLTEYVLYEYQISLYYSPIDYIWASAINEEGKDFDKNFYDLMLDIMYNRHDTAKPSRKNIKAMLLSHKPEAWEGVVKLLLAAQRQEGLRQTILECLDETNIGAMKALIKVILDEKLTRFSSVVRALDVWAGLGWEAQKESTIIRFMELGQRFLENPTQISEGIKSKDNAEVYMALWAQGIYDVEKCYPLLDELLAGDDHEKMLLALYFVSLLGLPKANLHYFEKVLKRPDAIEDLAVLSQVLNIFSITEGDYNKSQRFELFDILEKTLPNVPEKEKKFEGKVFSWLNFSIQKSSVLSTMIFFIDFKNEEEWDKIMPYFEKGDANIRMQITSLILPFEHYYTYDNSKLKPITKKQRDFALNVLKDRSTNVRDLAMRVLVEADISVEEIPIFIEMLTKKNTEVRKTVIALFLKFDKNTLMDTIQKLLMANTEQRLAGLDLLIKTKEDNLLDNIWIQKTTESFVNNPKTTQQELLIADKLLNKDVDVLSFKQENGFGLFDPTIITLEQKPSILTDGLYMTLTKNNAFGLSQSPEKINDALKELQTLFIKYKDYEYECEYWNKTKGAVLLGNEFSSAKYDISNLSNEEIFANYPLHEVWQKWAEDHKLTPLDIMLINLGANFSSDEGEVEEEKEEEIENEEYEQEEVEDEIPNNNNGTHTQEEANEWMSGLDESLKKHIFIAKFPTNITGNRCYNPAKTILRILPYKFQYPKNEQLSFLEGFLRFLYNQISEEDLNKYIKVKNMYWYGSEMTWRDASSVNTVYQAYMQSVNEIEQQENSDDDTYFKALWNLEKWRFQTMPKQHTRLEYYKPNLTYYIKAFGLKLIEKNELLSVLMTDDGIRQITHVPKKEEDFSLVKKYPFLMEFVELCRNRILEIELKRSNVDTAVTHLAQCLSSIYGMDYLMQIIVGLGSDKNIITTYGCSYLLKRCFALPTETQEDFNQKIKMIKVSTKRLVEIALFSPYWTKFIENYLDWKNMESAVWWLHAHTNGYHSAETETEIAKYSKVEITEFKDGAVDTKWFQEIYDSLGANNWKLMYDGAKYISDGNGHTRAKLYADVILGHLSLDEIHKRVMDKRNQDYLRVYGLVALDTKNADKDVLNRYQYLQKFKKESKQFGAQRQASEGLAVKISMDNLARTAGFPDPMRLTWAMETEEAIDIINKAKALEFGEITVSLVIDEYGQSSLETFKAGKPLKSIPANLIKNEKIIELKEFNKTLQDQYKRTRKSLEMAMIDGDEFTIKEIENLMRHPVVSPMLKKLVLKSDNQIGFWQEGKLVSANGKENLPKKSVQIAHCTDLFASKEWGSYQKHCFEKEIKQPFKQIFRELYTPTTEELKENAVSRRYAGHQVQPQKTVALLKSQGWTVNYDEGLQKVFHKEGFIAKIYAMADWFTPSDVESPTIETVEIINRKTWQNMPFNEISPRIFSEIMRDVDLVVSVAHVGDVDPEMSQSSIELRTVIVQETLRLFKITNVELKGTHALIKGTKGEYSVHLGSAIARKILGVTLHILPVHSQHRGKMFLPFLDEDPRTAELISKIILLAKDNEIQDPTILTQLV